MNRPLTLLDGKARSNGAQHTVPLALKEMLRNGLSILWRSYEYSRDNDPQGWDFSVDQNCLLQAGLSEIDLRWLLARGFLRGKLEASANGPVNDHFLLTDAGAAFALDVILSPMHTAPDSYSAGRRQGETILEAATESHRDRQKPHWDRDRKELRCGQWVIKHFRCAAANQETILMAFEEENWATRIDDPLPQKLDQEPKHRLHDTIKCLNRNHKTRLIRFNGDGTGEGVVWTFLDDHESARASTLP